MRLLTVGSLPPEWGGKARGGAATFHAALLTELNRRDNVDLLGVLPPTAPERGVAVPIFARADEVPRARHYEDLLDRLRPDVVLMNHVAHTVGVTHARLDSPPPAVGTIQSWHNVTGSSGAERRRAVDVTKEALTGLNAMVAVSRHTLAEGEELGFAYPPAVEMIHNPIPPLYMEDIDAGAFDRSGVIFLGSLIPRKRPDALVEAAAGIPELDVLLIGEGELEAALGERIAGLAISDRVHLAVPPSGEGHLPWVRDALLAAEVMCLPSASEGLPLAFVEALACGTPIVGFGPAVREIREELGIEIGEPLDGGSPDEIGAAIERVLAIKWDRCELRRAVLGGFGLDRVTDRYLALLAQAGVSGGESHNASPVGPPRRSAARQPGQPPICVLGPSRSGTSLTARLLRRAGVYLGPEEELLGAGRDQLAAEGEEVLARAAYSNPGGHFEHYRLMRLNERILRTMGGSWREPPPLPSGWEKAVELDGLREEAHAILAESFAGHLHWAWKDPRNSLTLPFWRDLLPELCCVVCLRHPIEVAESLRRRDGMDLAAGLEQWMRYLASALVNTGGLPRLLVRYEDYFRCPEVVAARLVRFAGREGAFDPPRQKALADAIDEGLWRHRLSADRQRPGTLPGDVGPLLRVVELLTSADSAGEGVAELNAAADRFAAGVLRRVVHPQPAAVA